MSGVPAWPPTGKTITRHFTTCFLPWETRTPGELNKITRVGSLAGISGGLSDKHFTEMEDTGETLQSEGGREGEGRIEPGTGQGL